MRSRKERSRHVLTHGSRHRKQNNARPVRGRRPRLIPSPARPRPLPKSRRKSPNWTPSSVGCSSSAWRRPAHRRCPCRRCTKPSCRAIRRSRAEEGARVSGAHRAGARKRHRGWRGERRLRKSAAQWQGRLGSAARVAVVLRSGARPGPGTRPVDQQHDAPPSKADDDQAVQTILLPAPRKDLAVGSRRRIVG
ncbi:hypothetical protein B0H14DRAFT_260918 [Mycena olivaceomarginata]|nr:hypothetical protein B0H14DRAFT_260918 [Mycena olivaceomarginata]